MKKKIGRLLIGFMLVVVFALAITRPSASYLPVTEIEAKDGNDVLSLLFVLEPKTSVTECEALTGNIARTTLKNCPNCLIRRLTCDPTSQSAERSLLSDAPIALPSGRLANGVVTFTSVNPEASLAACRAIEAQSSGMRTSVRCFPPGNTRPHQNSVSFPGYWLPALFVAALGAAWLVGWLVIRYEHLHAHLTHDHVDSGPQKFHVVPTPRIGGLALMVGLLAGGAIMLLSDDIAIEREFGLLLLAGLPAFLGGLVEDVTKKVGVIERLLLTMTASGAAAWLLGAQLSRIDIQMLNEVMKWTPFAIALTVFAVAGVANAINILDGYNGLVGGYSTIVLLAMAWVSMQVGDALIFSVALVVIGAMAGFLTWNWPGGKIFLGDGGAYLLGFFLGELSVLIVVRNSEISAWFPMLLLVHPVFETCFSIYRRKIRDGLSPGQPDNRHFHQLVYGCMCGNQASLLQRNSSVAKFIWGPTAVMAFAGAAYFRDSEVLIWLTAAYCILYVVAYLYLERQSASPFARVGG